MKIQVNWGLQWIEVEPIKADGNTATAKVIDRLGKIVIVKFKNSKHYTQWKPCRRDA
jgi:hypothetical protein